MSELAVQNQSQPVQQYNIMERVITTGDLSKLKPEERVIYYSQLCDSLGLNPLTQPFGYIYLNNKLALYANKGCTDQLRKIHAVSISVVARERIEDLYVVTARATMPDGRIDESTGIVSLNNERTDPKSGITTISPKRGDELANAIMKAETKAKRRVTLSVVGLGWIDESEVGSIPNAKVITVDHATGEIQPNTEQLRTDLKTALARLDTLKIEYPQFTVGDIKRMTDQKLADLIIEYNDLANNAEAAIAEASSDEF